MFFFLKSQGNGTYTLAEIYGNRRGNLTAHSFYNSKKKGITQRVNEILKSLRTTPETTGASLSDAKIPTLFEITDEKAEERRNENRKIVSQAKKNGTYMLAPNGERTKLDESQWVQVRSKNFKDWAGDWENDPDNASIVLDENEEPLVLNHFTTNEFSVFGKDKEIGENTFENTSDANYAATATIGDWFTTNDNADLEGKPMKVFLKIRNPYDGYSLENLAEEVGGKIKPEDYEAFDEDRDNTSPIIEAGKQVREELESEGYDGIVIEDEEVGGKSYVIFAPNQVKSATKNNGDFSKDNDNIYYRLKDGTFIKSGSYFSGGERASSESMITDKRNVEKRNSATPKVVFSLGQSHDRHVSVATFPKDKHDFDAAL